MAIRPLKRSLSGEEIEFFVLRPDGQAVNEAPQLVRKARRRKLPLAQEAGKAMVEISSFPSVKIVDTFVDLMEKMKTLMGVAMDSGYVLYPLATYPGKFDVELTEDRRYKEQAALFGEEKAKQAAQVCGFHYHYTLPRGVFDKKTRFLKQSKNSRLMRSMMDSYNLSIAADPATTTMLQSSPFVQGRYLAKDSRLLVYRGGRKLGHMQGKYALHQQLGGLPPYKQTVEDLMFSLRRRQQKWKEMMEKAKLDPAWMVKEDNVLDFTWNPVRINKLGTLELRGMDMNHPKNIMAMSTLLRFLFQRVYQEGIKVQPSDVGLHEPFKLEGDTIHIPPHTHVRNHLQKEAAYHGLESDEVLRFTQRFYRLCRQFVPEAYVPVVRPLYDMIEGQQTVSDVLIKRVRRMGVSLDGELPQNVAQELALKSCETLFKEVEHTEALLERAGKTDGEKTDA